MGIVASRFNSFIVEKLLEALWTDSSVTVWKEDDIDAVWVPGAFEIPLIAKLADSGRYDAIICVGAVIRGSTTHYELVVNETAKGIAQAGFNSAYR